MPDSALRPSENLSARNGCVVPTTRRLISSVVSRHGSRRVSTRGQEVYAKPADDAVIRQDAANPQPELLNLEPITVVGGEAAAHVHLARRSAEDLIVGGDEQHASIRTRTQLRAR